MISLRERIAQKSLIEDRGYASHCWTWQGRITPAGYGELSVDGKTTRAHRVSFEIWNGRISKGFVIDHLCRNRACVNPDHLEAVTQQENVLRGDGPASRTHCPSGHEYSPDNLIRHIHGARRCRECNRQRSFVSSRERREKGRGRVNASPFPR